MVFGSAHRRATVVLGLLALAIAGVAAVAAARCPTKDPVGYGLLEFGARADGAALESDLALGINPLFTWAELEPAEGQYDWRPIDEALRAAHTKGRKVAPRIYTNLVDHGQGTPDWVFEAGAAAYAMHDGSTVPQPVPGDPVFTQRFRAFLRAFGERYDGHPAIEFVQTNAGMGAYGEMVWWLDDSSRLGVSPRQQAATIDYWIDAWRAAFPETPLVLMQNFIGDGVAEAVTEHAVDRGFYLQSNSVSQEPAAEAILAGHDGRTKIVLEIEDNGCSSATGDALAAALEEVFGYDFAVDYLVVCGETFGDPAAQSAYDRLRKGD